MGTDDTSSTIKTVEVDDTNEDEDEDEDEDVDEEANVVGKRKRPIFITSIVDQSKGIRTE